MKFRKAAAILCAAVLVTGLGNAFPVRATELAGNPDTELSEDSGTGLSEDETEEAEPSADTPEEKKEGDLSETEEETEAAEKTELPAEEETLEEKDTAALALDEAKELSEESAEEETFQIATDLKWDEEHPGVISFTNPNGGRLSYIVYLYKNGRLWHSRQSFTNPDSAQTTEILADVIDSSGDYTFRIELFPEGTEWDWDDEDGYVTGYSDIYAYTEAAEKLAVPQNVHGDSAGNVYWDPVENAGGYVIDLYKDKEVFVYGVTIHYSGATSVDFSDKMQEDVQYYARVQAYSSDISKWAHSDYSELIELPIKEAAVNVDKTLNENISGEDVKEDVTNVKKAFSDSEKRAELCVAMQTSELTRDKIAGLEDDYMDKAGITVTVDPKDSGIDAGEVSILGAALNADENASVTFNISKPTEEEELQLIQTSGHKNGVVLDLGLEGAGIDSSALAIPVRITMPIPAGLDPARLVILHYKEDGSYESIDAYDNGDGTVSFTVTHFSKFMFTEVEAQNEGSGSSSKESGGSDEASAESGVYMSGADASTVTYVPEWKPATPDEAKRYSVVGKESVSFTADKSNAYPVRILNVMQGKLCFDSFEAVLGDYTIGRTYSIFPAGQTSYKMGSKVKITLNIPKALQAAGREFKMICVTEGGRPIVLDDLDTDQATITFETDTYYAFALIYKDAKAK